VLDPRLILCKARAATIAKPLLQRPKKKNMTLVAGFRCRDGFVIAADTEIQYSAVRFQTHKLAHYYGQGKSYDIIIGGAGDGVYIDATCQKIRDAVAAMSTPTIGAIKSAVEQVIYRLHTDSFFKHWQPEDPNRPRVQLIIAVQDQHRAWGLLQTFDDAIAEVEEHALAGTGTFLAEYIIERLWTPGMSAAVTVHLVQQLFREARIKGPYVGGNTELIGRRVTKDAEPFFDQDDINSDYRFLWGIDELTASAVRVALDHTRSAQLLDQRINDVVTRLHRIQASSDAPRSQTGDTIRITEFGSEYGNFLNDLDA
jgi:20S proteasome alpha/beta subunit